MWLTYVSLGRAQAGVGRSRAGGAQRQAHGGPGAHTPSGRTEPSGRQCVASCVLSLSPCHTDHAYRVQGTQRLSRTTRRHNSRSYRPHWLCSGTTRRALPIPAGVFPCHPDTRISPLSHTCPPLPRPLLILLPPLHPSAGVIFAICVSTLSPGPFLTFDHVLLVLSHLTIKRSRNVPRPQSDI